MLIPTPDRTKIHEHLFKEGVLVAPNNHLVQHPEVGVKNHYVLNACKSLASKGYVKKQYAWRHYYYTLTNEGVNYLRQVLHLPTEVIPSTFKRTQQAPMPRTGFRREREGGPGHRDRGDRDEYRRAPAGKDGGNARPDFRGFGRPSAE